MMGALNRRSLFGAVPAAALLGVAPTQAIAATDADLIDLGARYERAFAVYKQAAADAKVAYQTFKSVLGDRRPKVTAADLGRFGEGLRHDYEKGGLTPGGCQTLRRWLDMPHLRNQLAQTNGEQRVRELLEAWDRYEAEEDEISVATGRTATSDRETETYNIVDDLADEILSSTIRTMAGARVVARVAEWDETDRGDEAGRMVASFVLRMGAH